MQADGLAAAPRQQSHAWTIYMRAPAGFAVEALS
jgi:hypothetical protein